MNKQLSQWCKSGSVMNSSLNTFKMTPTSVTSKKFQKIETGFKQTRTFFYVPKEWYRGMCFLIILAGQYLFVILTIIKTKHFLIVIESILYIATTSFIMLSAYSNPGTFPHIIILKSRFSKTSSVSVLKNVYTFKKKFYVLRGRLFKRKICRTCAITRPLDCSHCRRCNHCIYKFDHHCPWVGNCIGGNNYIFFFLLILVLNIYLIFNIIMNSLLLKTYSDKKGIHKKYFIYTLLLLVLYIPSLGFVMPLFIVHNYFIKNGQTTYMKIKFKELFEIIGNLYDKGWLTNFCTRIRSKKEKICFDYKEPKPNKVRDILERGSFADDSCSNMVNFALTCSLSGKVHANILRNCFFNNSDLQPKMFNELNPHDSCSSGGIMFENHQKPSVNNDESSGSDAGVYFEDHSTNK